MSSFKNERKAYLCCRRELKEHYRELWNEKIDIPVVAELKNATDLYLISEKDIAKDEKVNAIEMAEKLKIRVHYLDRELMKEEAAEYVKKVRLNRVKELEL